LLQFGGFDPLALLIERVWFLVSGRYRFSGSDA
jgi:hypothetical protein